MKKSLKLLLIIALLGGCRQKPDTPTAVTAVPLPTADTAVTAAPAEPSASAAASAEPSEEPTAEAWIIPEDTECDDKDCVALYLYTYDELPSNYMTKKEARKYGWESGPLWKVIDGKCIGGDYYGNYEENLPEARNRDYYECDIDTLGRKKRGVKRIVYSNDGLIYYTDDHYETFELLYGEE
ncbi:MAG: ribonuclease [Solobacterium sp.]|nr:ribonuclease [Solobacterium sp.]